MLVDASASLTLLAHRNSQRTAWGIRVSARHELGVRRVEVARHFLEKRGIIELSRKQMVILHRLGLKAAANGTRFVMAELRSLPGVGLSRRHVEGDSHDWDHQWRSP
jgi:hypothetical protein